MLAELAQKHDRARLPEDAAGDAVWAVSSPEVYPMLVVDRGWSRRRYSDWLAETLAASLLG